MSSSTLNTTRSTDNHRQRSVAKQSWYQAIWRWHFYAGVIFAPFLIILAVSGGVYLFKPQIESTLYRDLLTVPVAAEQTAKLSPDDVIAIVKQTYSNAAVTSINSITVDNNPQASYKLGVFHNGVSNTMYVNPYTGEILGMLDSTKTFTAFFKKMHSELVIGGTFANRLVELAACWAFILLATGLYLWWPRGKQSVWGTVLPRLSKPGSRVFWRDLHAVPAFWLSLVLLVIIASGLPWSGIMGQNISKLATATNTNTPPYAYIWDGTPQSVTLAKDIAEDLPWAAENLPVPSSSNGITSVDSSVQSDAVAADSNSASDSSSALDHSSASSSPSALDNSSALGSSSDLNSSSLPGESYSLSGSYVTLGINDIQQVADRYQVKAPYTITLPSGSGGVYTLSASADNPVHNATLHVDQYSGAVLTDVRFADYGIMAKVISYGIAFHEGTLFGLANQLLGLAACLGLIVIVISSYMMWLKRKPSGKLGAPAKAKNNKITLGVLLILLACGAIMPLVGISIIAVLILDLFILRRIKPLRAWFSL